MRTKEIKGLKDFYYYDVNESFSFGIENNDYFQRKVFTSEERQLDWNHKTIDFSKADPNVAFDSGIICAEAEQLSSKEGTISELRGFVAPYQLMKKSIGSLSHVEQLRGQRDESEIAVGIGMVLSIIATKGSSGKGNHRPYIVLVERNNSLRMKQLDVSVVEGLNCGDFYPQKQAYLHCIAKRALEEEQGINTEFLSNLGLLKMPSKYYFGYDKQYHQWNFFGTVCIDCTIEEIIREGHYFTKDKFEISRIIGIPLEPKHLFYFLNREKVFGSTSTVMWATGWASILFAIQDMGLKTNAINRMCISNNRKRRRIELWENAREKLVEAILESKRNGKSADDIKALINENIEKLTDESALVDLKKQRYAKDKESIIQEIITEDTEKTSIAKKLDALIKAECKRRHKVCCFINWRSIAEHCRKMKQRVSGWFDSMAFKSGKGKNRIDIVSALLAQFLIVSAVVWTVFKTWGWFTGRGIDNLDISGFVLTWISTIITVITSFLVAVMLRYEIVACDDMVCLEVYDREKNPQYTFEEIRVFRNVSLIDGNIAEKDRKVYFDVENVGSTENPRVTVLRKCRVFYTDRTDESSFWTLREEQKQQIEHFRWIIKCPENTQASLRFVIPLIYKHSIMLKESNGFLEQVIDISVPFSEFGALDEKKSDNSDLNIRYLIQNKVKEALNCFSTLSLPQYNIDFRFLFKDENGYSIIGFIEMDRDSGSFELFPLSYDLSNTSFSLRLKDDITRVACEYAVAEKIGYRMSSR